MSNKSDSLSNMFAGLDSNEESQESANIYDFSERKLGEVNTQIKAQRKSGAYKSRHTTVYIDANLKPRLMQKLLTENGDRGEITQVVNDLLYLYLEGHITLPSKG
jgi:hypothetical protein